MSTEIRGNFHNIRRKRLLGTYQVHTGAVTRASNEGYPKVRKDVTITEKALTRTVALTM